jgi:CubicO group peptidase (beta-lactamase class C family)
VRALDAIAAWPADGACAGVLANASVVATTGDTTRVLPWASITKPLTALAVLIAVEEGSLGLDDAAGPPGSTVRHLLAHASGLDFESMTTLSPPGTRRTYSNAGYEVLGATLEAATGIPFGDYLREAVLQPLGLRATTLEGSAAAGLHGPLDDLLLVARELQAPMLLAPETAALMRTVAFSGLAGVLPGFGRQDPNDWALGCELRGDKDPHWTGVCNSPSTFGHFGGGGGFLWVDPDAGVACASLSDRPFGEWAAEVWPRLSDAVLDEIEAARRDRPPR